MYYFLVIAHVCLGFNANLKNIDIQTQQQQKQKKKKGALNSKIDMLSLSSLFFL